MGVLLPHWPKGSEGKIARANNLFLQLAMTCISPQNMAAFLLVLMMVMLSARLQSSVHVLLWLVKLNWVSVASVTVNMGSRGKKMNQNIRQTSKRQRSRRNPVHMAGKKQKKINGARDGFGCDNSDICMNSMKCLVMLACLHERSS